MKILAILIVIISPVLITPSAHSAQLEIPELAVITAGWKMSKIKEEPDEFYVMVAFREALDRKTFRLTVNGVDFTPFLEPIDMNLSAFSLPMPISRQEIEIEGHPNPDASVKTAQRHARISLREIIDVAPGASSLSAVSGDRRHAPMELLARFPPDKKQQ